MGLVLAFDEPYRSASESDGRHSRSNAIFGYWPLFTPCDKEVSPSSISYVDMCELAVPWPKSSAWRSCFVT